MKISPLLFGRYRDTTAMHALQSLTFVKHFERLMEYAIERQRMVLRESLRNFHCPYGHLRKGSALCMDLRCLLIGPFSHNYSDFCPK